MRDRKKPTLRERAEKWWEDKGSASCLTKNGETDAYLAGHRANRLTKAEREVVEAAKKWVLVDGTSDTLASAVLNNAVSNLERAKGRK